MIGQGDAALVRETAGEYHFDAPRSQIYVQGRQAWLFFSQLGRRMDSLAGDPGRGPYDSVLDGGARAVVTVPDFWWLYFPLAGRGAGATSGVAFTCAGLLAAGVVVGRSGREAEP